MKTTLQDVARIHFALTIESEEDVNPILWMYEHFLREALEFPFKNPVHEFWGEGGAPTETMVNALSEGETYIYFADSMYAEYYCKGLATSIEWGYVSEPLTNLTNYFHDVAEGDVDERLIDNMMEEFEYITHKLCSEETLTEAYDIASKL